MLHHVAIGTLNLMQMSEFYDCLPGLRREKIVRDADGTVRAVWYRIKNSEALLMLERSNRIESPRALVFKSMPHKAELKIVSSMIFNRTEYTVYFKDPDGNVLGYSCYPEKY